jgi:ankyrin repeat protein
MNAKELPARPSLEQYKKQAKDLLKSCKAGNSEAVQRIKKHHPRLSELQSSAISSPKIALADAQFTIAREYGFESWPKFAKEIERLNTETFVAGITDPVAAFVEAASVPLDGSWHASGTLDRAEAILAAYQEVGNRSIYTTSILGDDAGVQRFIARDAKSATAKGGPYDWDALTYLCFSRYLRLDRGRSGGFVRAATALLDAGASVDTGWLEKNHQPEPEWESAIYGAAGVAHHAELTRLLLERGADPNDHETPYHAPETYDNAALKVLVESGKLTDDSLATILLRKTDWHDYEGIQWLLERGVNTNQTTRWGRMALLHAVHRDNSVKIIEALLDHGADPALMTNPKLGNLGSASKSAVAMAARRGRGDLLELFERRGFAIELQGVERLIGACARNDAAGVRSIAESEPHLVDEVLKEGGTLLAEFAGNGNTDGVWLLLDLGVPVTALYGGDAYFDIAKDSPALHVAAWKAHPPTVKLLIERGTPVNALDGKGRTALALAVRACVDSYWTHRRSPDSVEALLRAGASVEDVDYPSGYAEVDDLLLRYGRSDKL